MKGKFENIHVGALESPNSYLTRRARRIMRGNGISTEGIKNNMVSGNFMESMLPQAASAFHYLQDVVSAAISGKEGVTGVVEDPKLIIRGMFNCTPDDTEALNAVKRIRAHALERFGATEEDLTRIENTWLSLMGFTI